LGFAQLHLALDVEHGFAATISDVDVDRAMFVAVKQKLETVLVENRRHRAGIMAEPQTTASRTMSAKLG
jgi:hypothetical protein